MLAARCEFDALTTPQLQTVLREARRHRRSS